MTLEELAKACKASVSLEINGHRNVYETIEEYICDGDYVTPEVMARFREGADVFELQFYPNCPVGFCRVWGTSLAEVLEQAQVIFQEGRDPLIRYWRNDA